MELDRGVLTRIDRKLLAGLGQDETFRMVRVPVTAAIWSNWRRYCDAAGMSMGRAVAVLIGHELSKVVGETGDDSPVLTGRVGEELAKRQAEVARLEQELKPVEDRLRAWQQHLRQRERATSRLVNPEPT